MKNPAVLVKEANGIATITLNRPDNRNSMTPELLAAFIQAIKSTNDNKNTRVVIVTGMGDCFSAGADFRSQVQVDNDMSMPHEKSYDIYAPFLSVLDIKVPVIAALNGHAVGGGFGLALACDIRLARATSKYGANFCQLGITPGMGLSHSLPALVGFSKASELFYTGKLFSGHDAYQWGLVSSAHQSDVLAHAMEIATQIAKNAPLALRLTKKMLRASMAPKIKRAAEIEALYQSEILKSHDAKEGMQALLEKRQPDFNGLPPQG